MKMRRFIAGLAVATLATTGHSQTLTIEQRLEQLEQEIRLLKHQRDLEREATQKPTAPAAPATAGPTVKAGMDGFSLQSADGSFALKLRGYVQADARFYLSDSAKNGLDTFLVRRARPIFDATFYQDFDARLMLDAGQGQALLQDAYVEWKHWPEMKLRVGKFKPPVGLEHLQQDTWLFFAERGLPASLLPVRDVGVQVAGDLFDGVVSYGFGVFNGVVDGGMADLDAFDSKDFAARIFIHPFKKTDIAALKGFGFGLGGTIGEQQAPTTTNLPSYKSTGQNTFFSYLAGVAPAGVETRLTPQSFYYWGPLGLMGEYVANDQKFSKAPLVSHLQQSAWQIQGSFVLTGENATYTGVTPRRPFDLKAGGWGAFELVARYGAVYLDPSAFSTSPLAADTRFASPIKSAQQIHEWGVGLNWYLNKNIKLVLNYEQSRFDGGAGTAGATTFTVQDRPTEHFFLTRTQLTF